MMTTTMMIITITVMLFLLLCVRAFLTYARRVRGRSEDSCLARRRRC